jgi:carbonic anhydrase
MHGCAPGEGGFVADWISLLDEAREPIARDLGTTGSDAERAMEQAAVKVSLENLRTFPCVRELEKRHELTLRGAFFAISDGVLHLLDERSGKFKPA